VLLIISNFSRYLCYFPFVCWSLCIALRHLNLCSSSTLLTCHCDLIRVTGVRTRSQNCENRLLDSSFPSARPHGTTRLPPSGFQWNMIRVIFGNSSRKFQFHYNLARIAVSLREDLCTLIISHLFLVRMRSAADKLCREHRNTRFMFSNVFRKVVSFMRQCRKVVEPDRQQMLI